jgi:hypothetical protein
VVPDVVVHYVVVRSAGLVLFGVDAEAVGSVPVILTSCAGGGRLSVLYSLGRDRMPRICGARRWRRVGGPAVDLVARPVVSGGQAVLALGHGRRRRGADPPARRFRLTDR